MKTKITKEIVEELGNKATIHDIRIGDEIYRLSINNERDNGQKVILSFSRKSDINPQHSDDEFTISIDCNKKMWFSRYVSRPTHDHDDTDYLQMFISEDPFGMKKLHEPFWFSRFPYKGDGKDFFTIDFGPVTVDY
jgi:hypothetical protein